MDKNSGIPSYNDGDCILFIRNGEFCKGYVCGIHPISLDIEVVEEVTEERTYVRDSEIVGKVDHVGCERYEYVPVPDPSAPDGIRLERRPASSGQKEQWSIEEEVEAACFAASLAMENPGDYTVDELQEIVDRMRARIADLEDDIRKEFFEMPLEAQRLAFEQLASCPEERERWERLLLSLDDLPSAPPED